MNIPGKKYLQRAERKGNEARVPMTRRLGAVELFKQAFRQASQDHLSAFAGNLTYKGLFALFPFFVFLLSLLGLFQATDLVNTLLDQAAAAIPQDAIGLIRDQILAITESQAGGALTAGALIGIVAALWGVSGAFRAVMEAMNVMYDVEETRPFWKQYAISIFLALGVALLLVTALVLVVAGPEIGGAVADAVGLGSVFYWTWSILQWPILAAFVLFAFALVYYFAPAVEQRFRWISLGSVLAFVLWLAFSLLFSLYVNNFGSYNATYGALAGVAILMLYIYYSAYILLFGAEVNQVVEEHIPEGKDPGEKTPDEG
jgi:membrane protein